MCREARVAASTRYTSSVDPLSEVVLRAARSRHDGGALPDHGSNENHCRWRIRRRFGGANFIPTYLSLLVPGSHYLLVVRILRLLRVFRVLKLAEHLTEADVLMRALRASRRKISVFLLTVLTMVVVIGTLLYVIEGEENGFTSIPVGIYWAVVTLTTVGYGDISPKTPAGQTLAAVVMIIGYGIIAVPTGIVTVEIAQAVRKPVSTQACPDCASQGHDADAVHCKYCGAKL